MSFIVANIIIAACANLKHICFIFFWTPTICFKVLTQYPSRQGTARNRIRKYGLTLMCKKYEYDTREFKNLQLHTSQVITTYLYIHVSDIFQIFIKHFCFKKRIKEFIDQNLMMCLSLRPLVGENQATISLVL